tara:strand:- start:173 stop:322 length:150 start_codon:yes stop_codon:yes gene_type:complete
MKREKGREGEYIESYTYSTAKLPWLQNARDRHGESSSLEAHRLAAGRVQ